MDNHEYTKQSAAWGVQKKQFQKEIEVLKAERDELREFQKAYRKMWNRQREREASTSTPCGCFQQRTLAEKAEAECETCGFCYCDGSC